MNVLETSSRWAVAVAVVIAAVAAGMPFLVSAFWLNVLIGVVILAMYAMSYDLLLGRTGLFSFGHALFLGSSAYVVAYLTSHHTVPLGVSLLLGVVVATVLAGLVGVVLSRVRGIYFGMLSLAIAQVGFSLADRDVGGFTGGENGLLVSDIPPALNANVGPVTLYWTVLGVGGVVLVILAVIRASAAGRLWLAIRENEVRAQSLGVDVRRQRWLVFTIAGAFAGVAGALHAVAVQTVTPSVLAIAMTVQALLCVVIGGVGTTWGPLLGALFVGMLPPLLDTFGTWGVVTSLPATLERAATSYFLVLGICYILIVLFLPGGFVAGLRRVAGAWRTNSQRPDDAGITARARSKQLIG